MVSVPPPYEMGGPENLHLQGPGKFRKIMMGGPGQIEGPARPPPMKPWVHFITYTYIQKYLLPVHRRLGTPKRRN